MFNTVPSTVTLSDVIVPMVWKGVDIIMDITTTGIVSLSGEIRNLYNGTSSTPLTTASYTYTSSSGNSSAFTTETYNATTGAGTSQFGNTSYYAFNVTLDSPGTTLFNIEDNISYPINDEIFILPNWSVVNQTAKSVSVYASALSSSIPASGNLTGVLMVPTSQSGTVTHTIVNTTLTMEEVSVAGDYTIFGGEATVERTGFPIIALVYLGDGEVKSRTVKVDLFPTTT
jgi:hypothetical protein